MDLNNSLISDIKEANIRPEFLLDIINTLRYDLNFHNSEGNTSIVHLINRHQNIFTLMQNRQMKISDFETVRVIGRGGFGKVELVKQQKSQKYYAIKRLGKGFITNNLHWLNVFVERDIMSTSSSPWLMQLHYAFQDEINLYMVMDFMPGGELLNLVRKKIKEDEIRFYAAEIVLAVDALHAMDYIHGDIKLENFLIGCDGHLKLSDFGVSLKLDSFGEASLKFLVGTPGKLPIEVLTSSYRGKISDWWSVGICIYEMISGNLLFTGGNYLEILFSVIQFLANPIFPGVEMSEEAKSLLLSLLTTRDCRLGARGVWEIKKHPFFSSPQWNFETIRTVRPPFVPELDTDFDCKYIEYAKDEDMEMVSGATYINHLFFIDYSIYTDPQKESQEENPHAVIQREANLKYQTIRLQREKTALKSDNSKLQEKMSSLEKQNDKLHGAKCDLEDQNYELQEKISALENHTNELLEEKCDLENQNYELQKKISTLENQNYELQEEKWDLENLNYELQEEKCELEDQNYELQEKVSALENQSSTLQEKKCDLEDQDCELRGKISIIEDQDNEPENKKELEKIHNVMKKVKEKLPSLSQVKSREKRLKPKRSSKREISRRKPKMDLCILEEPEYINCMGHEFVERTYRTPSKCACCGEDLWNLFRPPQAVKCIKCHLRIHQHHLDAEDGFILMCTGTSPSSSQLPDEPPAEGGRSGPALTTRLRTLVEKKNKKQARHNPSPICRTYQQLRPLY